MKRVLSSIKRQINTTNPSGLLSNILLGFVLVIYAYTVYTIVVALGTFPFGKIPNPSLLPSAGQWLLNLVALLCVSLTLVPVSRWLQGHINDLIYAQDDNLYALPAAINQILREMQNPQLTMPQIVETIGMVLHLPYVVLEFGPEGKQRFSFGSPLNRASTYEFPLHYLNERLGTLLVSKREANQSLSPSDRVVLLDCAQQIGIALYVVQLTDVLQTSREKIVIAHEEERRRIRNDLHDGLAPSLSSFQLQLGAIRKLLTQSPEQAEQMVIELSADLRNATAEIRQLVYDLRPPMLDELGLIKALSNIRLTGSSLQLEVRAPDPMPELSAATEVAIYRIATEAVHNVIKHADATICTIGIMIETETLVLTITDNGQGIPAEHYNGIGTQSMRERAAELGGTLAVQPTDPNGTRIEVRLPWRNGNG